MYASGKGRVDRCVRYLEPFTRITTADLGKRGACPVKERESTKPRGVAIAVGVPRTRFTQDLRDSEKNSGERTESS